MNGAMSWSKVEDLVRGRFMEWSLLKRQGGGFVRREALKVLVLLIVALVNLYTSCIEHITLHCRLIVCA